MSIVTSLRNWFRRWKRPVAESPQNEFGLPGCIWHSIPSLDIPAWPDDLTAVRSLEQLPSRFSLGVRDDASFTLIPGGFRCNWVGLDGVSSSIECANQSAKMTERFYGATTITHAQPSLGALIWQRGSVGIPDEWIALIRQRLMELGRTDLSTEGSNITFGLPDGFNLSIVRLVSTEQLPAINRIVEPLQNNQLLGPWTACSLLTNLRAEVITSEESTERMVADLSRTVHEKLLEVSGLPPLRCESIEVEVGGKPRKVLSFSFIGYMLYLHVCLRGFVPIVKELTAQGLLPGPAEGRILEEFDRAVALTDTSLLQSNFVLQSGGLRLHVEGLQLTDAFQQAGRVRPDLDASKKLAAWTSQEAARIRASGGSAG